MLRLKGDFAAASAEYQQIIERGKSDLRARAGLAEIAKRKGLISESRQIYEELLREKLDSKSRFVYRLAFANVLVRQGDFTEAYRVIDSVVVASPFSIAARTMRAAVEGLLGDPLKALGDLPKLKKADAFNEWISGYVRGLLLLLLDRFEDGRYALLQNVRFEFRNTDGDSMLRLGSAVCLLRTAAGIEKAEYELEQFPASTDAYVAAIVAALKYHVAMALRREKQIAELKAQLARVPDSDLQLLVAAIEVRDWKRAWQYEIKALLRLQIAA